MILKKTLFFIYRFLFQSLNVLLNDLNKNLKVVNKSNVKLRKDVILYAQTKWPITFSRVFEIQMLSGPLIDEVAFATISIGRDKIRFI